jgi:transposase-like protein
MLRTTLRRSLAVGAAALVLGGSTLGLANAQVTPTAPAPTPGQSQQAPGPEHQRFLEALAKRLGITTDQLRQAIREARSDAGLPADRSDFGHGSHRGVALGVTAQAIGITPQELRQELPGKSVAQVAQAHGKNPADVAMALTNAANQRIDQEVAAGTITADQAAQRKQTVDQAIAQAMNEVWSMSESAPAKPTPRATPPAGT